MMAPLLLDTCAVLWLMDDAPMRDEAVEAIDRSFDEGLLVHVSPITAWEIGLLATTGRFKTTLSPRRWVERLTGMAAITLCELPAQLLLESSFLPGQPPKDPADRIIAATGREYGLTVVTRERSLLAYAREGHLSALEC
jgi:PIN domain nuclease of toxin-antitoxin system